MAHIIHTLMAAALLAAPNPALAQQGAANVAPALSVELNTATQIEGACQLTFLATSPQSIDQLVLETVLITRDGAVDRLTLFDLRDIPAARPRVRQFNVPQLTCDDLGQVLINGVATCDGAGLTPAICAAALTLTTRTDIEVSG